MHWCYRFNRVVALVWTAILVPAAFPCFDSNLLLPTDLHTAALSAIDAAYNEHYKEAETIAERIIKSHPGHPSGYFFKAVAEYLWMKTHLSQGREDEFFRLCETSIEKGETMAEKDPGDRWSRFFIAGAEGIMGIFELHHNHLIQAAKWGSRGMSVLQALQRTNDGMVDLDYGIGSYEYWRGALIKRVWWLPAVEDQRADAINKLRNARRQGIYTASFSGESLVDVYLNEKSFFEALGMCEDMLKSYPTSRIFLLGRAEALDGLGEFQNSQATYDRILNGLGRGLAEDSVTDAFVHFRLGRLCFQQKRYGECLLECDSMQKIGSSGKPSEALKKYLEEESMLRKLAEAAQKRSIIRVSEDQ
jgi:hypothetical protein